MTIELAGEPPTLNLEDYPKYVPPKKQKRCLQRKFWNVIDLDGENVLKRVCYTRPHAIDQAVWILLNPLYSERGFFNGNSQEWRTLYGYGFRCVPQGYDGESYLRDWDAAWNAHCEKSRNRFRGQVLIQDNVDDLRHLLPCAWMKAYAT